MDLTEKEVGMLRRIVTDDAYNLLIGIGDALVKKWNANPSDNSTEWTMARDATTKEERKKAIDLFLKTINDLAHGKE